MYVIYIYFLAYHICWIYSCIIIIIFNNYCKLCSCYVYFPVLHPHQGRSYASIEAYVRAGRPLLDALGIKTILLFTDSSAAIEEAMNCKRDFPDVCGDIIFRYVDKKRWKAAEGGWENPFPSGKCFCYSNNILSSLCFIHLMLMKYKCGFACICRRII